MADVKSGMNERKGKRKRLGFKRDIPDFLFQREPVERETWLKGKKDEFHSRTKDHGWKNASRKNTSSVLRKVSPLRRKRRDREGKWDGGRPD